MRTSMTALFIVILLFGISRQTVVSQSSNLAIPQSAIAEDPNTNPDWDWRFGDDPSRIYPDAAYTMYHKADNTTINAHYVDAPWTDPANANAGLGDNKKEDGWVLIGRDFGTPTRGITGVGAGARIPYFLLYNKYRSIARIFVLAQTTTPWDKGFVEVKFQNPSNPEKTPAVLAHFKPVADAIDKFTNMKNNVNSVFSNVLQKNIWLWADFPLSYDPTITPKPGEDPPRFYVTVWGQKLSDIGLKGISSGVSGKANFVNDWLTGSGLDFGNGSVGIPNLEMPNVDLGKTSIDLGNFQFKPSATHVNWNSFKDYFNKISIKIPSVSTGNPFKGLFSDLGKKISSFTDALPISLPGLDIGGLFDFFVNGGAKQQAPAEPAPTYIAMNLEFGGTITETTPIHFFQITIPRTRDEYWKPTWGSSVGIVRNEPVGVLTLTETPVVYQKQYYFRVRLCSSPPNCFGVPEYVTVPMFEFELAEVPQISLNGSSGLDLKNCEVSLVGPGKYLPGSPPLKEYVDNIGLNKIITDASSIKNQRNLVEFESALESSKGIFRSFSVPLQFSKGRTLLLPQNSTPQSEVKLKIKTTFQRKDDPYAQPVVFIATYNVDIVERTDLPTQQILPTIPPQNVICTVPFSGGVRVSWDRNRERNIKYYAVERSINGGTYFQIGTTPDTLFVDTQIQKAVKPYQANRKNVQVYYRVRALSEWTDDDGSVKSQYSVYSNVINIQGSMIAAIEKKSFTQIVPESDYLSQNFPNPFNPMTTIYYGVKEEGLVTIKIFNSLGQEIATLVNGRKEVGYHYAEWNASAYPSGVYYYRITNGAFTETKRMVLAK